MLQNSPHVIHFNRILDFGEGVEQCVGKDARFLNKLCQSLAKMSERHRKLLLSLAEKMPQRRK